MAEDENLQLPPSGDTHFDPLLRELMRPGLWVIGYQLAGENRAVMGHLLLRLSLLRARRGRPLHRNLLLPPPRARFSREGGGAQAAEESDRAGQSRDKPSRRLALQGTRGKSGAELVLQTAHQRVLGLLSAGAARSSPQCAGLGEVSAFRVRDVGGVRTRSHPFALPAWFQGFRYGVANPSERERTPGVPTVTASRLDGGDSRREVAGAELVDRCDSVIRDRKEMVLLEHPLARLRMDEVQPRAKVRDIADLIHVRVDEPNSVEHVEHLPQTCECRADVGHVCEPWRA
jgi:hypothetical protein